MMIDYRKVFSGVKGDILCVSGFNNAVAGEVQLEFSDGLGRDDLAALGLKAQGIARALNYER